MTSIKEMDAQTFIEKNERLVHKVCQRYIPVIENIKHITGADYDDLYQLGMIGMLKAKERFNPDMGLKFSTYAVPMIIGEIRRFLRDGGMVKTSRWIKESYNKLRLLELEDADACTVAAALNLTIEQAKTVMNYTPHHKSFSQTVYKEDSGDDITLEETLYEDSFEEQSLNNQIVADFMATLTERERAIWQLYHGEGQKQSSVAKRFGISQVQVSRILSKIEKKAERFGRVKGYTKK